MGYKVNKSKCVGCGACVNFCPHNAIKIGEDGKAFIDQNKCKKCGICQRACSFNAIKEISDTSISAQIPSDSSINTRQGFNMRKGIGRGLGRGLGNGSRDGRGGGRGRRMGQ
jgi:Fe-S-cluster-containing hydrogenase component 2